MKDHGFVCLSNNETVKEAILTERYIFISDFVDKMKLSLCSSHYEDDHQCPESCISFSPIKVNDLVTVMGKMKPSSSSLEILPPSVLFGTFTITSLLSIISNSLRKVCGFFQHITFDRGPQFTSCIWREFYAIVGAKVSLSSGVYLHINRKTKRANQELEALSTWSKQLSWINNTVPWRLWLWCLYI